MELDASLESNAVLDMDIAYSINGAKLSVPSGSTGGDFRRKNAGKLSSRLGFQAADFD